MKRKFLLVMSVLLILFLAAGCGGQKEPVPAATQEVAQPTNPTPAPEQVGETPAQPGATDQAAPASSPATEPTQEPTPEQAAPTEVASSTPEAASTDTSPTPAPTQAAASPDTAACVNKAAFYDDVTIPDDTVIRQGEKFTKVWRVRNEGDCSWKDYQLVYAGGEAMSASPANPVPAAGPGEIIDISVDMTAPVRGGTHLSYWQFSTTDGQTFGVGSGANGMLWARILVDYVSGGKSTTNTSGSSTTTSVSTSENTTTTTGSTSGSSNTSSGSAGSNASQGNKPANCDYTLNAGYESQILALINDARANNGLSSVSRDPQLDAAALDHSLDMACNDFISHTGSDGSLWYQRVSKQGFANSNAARENIYTGSPDFGGDANGAFTWWMNSQIHRDNILFESASVIGISYVYSANATYGGLYTLIMARP